ncbi:MAG: aldo/keto reductase family protein [Candidatus Sericytochromatia bacterium]
MEYRRLGKTGIKVSEVSLGTWLTYGKTVEIESAKQCFKTAFEHGVNFFDTANIYAYGESEKVVGNILQDFNRSDIVLGTKVYFPMSQKVNDRGLSRKHIMESCNASLKRLKTDYIDLYQCHRYDTQSELEEVISAMDDLVKQGKVLYWGVSQWSAVQICDANHLSRFYNKTKPVSNQPVYNMLNRSLEVDVMSLCEREGMGLVVWSPLAEGVLTGKYSGGKIPEDSRAANTNSNMFIKNRLSSEKLEKVDQLVNIAKELEISMPQLALAWCLRRPELSSVIIGASKPEQVIDNVKASGIKLTDEVLDKIENILNNAPRDQYADY